MDLPLNQPYYGFDPNDVLMVGMGTTALMYYRIMLPARGLGCDYVGLLGEPPNTQFRTGLVGGDSVMPDFTKYKIVVLQQPAGDAWLNVIRTLRAQGTVVVYEVDDWLHAIKNMPDHAYRDRFQSRDLAELEKCMKACDAMIVATPYLAAVYKRFNKRVFVCENGIDIARYNLTRPVRPTVNIGWAGATGHAKSVEPWLRVIGDLMLDRPHVNFVSIGQPFARALHPYFGEERAIATPFAAVEQYPAAMTMIDVAIAPSGTSGFQRAKSDLRWLEAGALGIPLVAHPDVYRDIEHGVTGFHARTPAEAQRFIAELVDNEGLRITIGENARTVVRATRDYWLMADQWRNAFRELSGNPLVAA